MTVMTPGARVVFADATPGFLPVYEPVGVVVTPTDEEIDYARETYADRGPEHGDLLVEWEEGGESERAWHRPDELRPLADLRP